LATINTVTGQTTDGGIGQHGDDDGCKDKIGHDGVLDHNK
jgi:hypothetical protein